VHHTINTHLLVVFVFSVKHLLLCIVFFFSIGCPGVGVAQAQGLLGLPQGQFCIYKHNNNSAKKIEKKKKKHNNEDVPSRFNQLSRLEAN
jgi:hypothetical protein